MTRYIGVPLAILGLLILVGILTGEVTHGRSLIENASISDTARQLKTIETASNVFYKKYNSFPGDVSEPGQLITECKSLNCPSGNYNSVLDKEETEGFWAHLRAAKLLPDATAFENLLEGHFLPFYYAGKSSLPYADERSDFSKGHYIAFIKNNKIDAGSYFLTAQRAARIDRKIDDGFPLSGKIIAATEERCIKINEDSKKIYNEEYRKPCAFLYFKMISPETHKKN